MRLVRGPSWHPAGIALAVCAAALGCYLARLAAHPLVPVLNWFDLHVYQDAGELARRDPSQLYRWHLRHGIKFTYTPLAAAVFAAASLLPWAVLRWLMTAVSLAALPAAGWLTAGALGWQARSRLTMALLLAAAGLWTEPVQLALALGQIDLLLMTMLLADRCVSDRRWWKGAAIGVAGGIKLVPLIFVPYLLLAGKFRQAAVAAAAFAATIAAGFALLPGPSAHFWLTGYFLRVQNVNGVGSLVNQSVLGMIVRAEAGHLAAARTIWLPIAVVLAAAGLAAAAVLHRSGRPVHGWVLCALTGLLVSPISWDHHWVWIVPILAVTASEALRRRGLQRRACWAVTGALTLIFFAWPAPAGRQPRGLLGLFPGRSPAAFAFRLHGIQLLGFNLFVLAGLASYAAGLVMAARTVRTARTAGPGVPAPAICSARGATSFRPPNPPGPGGPVPPDRDLGAEL